MMMKLDKNCTSFAICLFFFFLAEGCQHLELEFVPFQLTHAE